MGLSRVPRQFFFCVRGLLLALSSLPIGHPALAECRILPLPHSELSDFIERLNLTRSEAGLGSLRLDALLEIAARRYACRSYDEGHFEHIGPDGSTPSTRVRAVGYEYILIGENLARGAPTLTSADDGWRNSPGHYANYLLDGAKHFAVAGATGPAVDADSQSIAALMRERGITASSSVGATPLPSSRTTVWVMLVGSSR